MQIFTLNFPEWLTSFFAHIGVVVVVGLVVAGIIYTFFYFVFK